ncbi:MAG: DUF362 domain-containing protein [Peptostreptococcaceae bacterium]|nr:DUF362 domain-containing protein [Peptostreptococcaceae bacterium]
MEKSKVYFTDYYSIGKNDNLSVKIKRLCDKAGFGNLIEENNLVAVKLHFGEKGNITYLHPVNVRQVVDKVKEYGGKPFLTDTNTLYSGSRTNTVDHIQSAIENGFSYSVVGAPIVIADGLYSKNSVDVKVNLKHYEDVKIGGEIYNADAMVVISHFKGHGMAGFGGVLKNLAMGCATAPGKQMQHSDVLPTVNPDECIGCRRCYSGCRVKAIEMVDKVAVINHDICYGCGECVTVCPTRAIDVEWETESDVFVEKMAEYAFGSIQNKKGKVGFITFVTNITPMCDCAGFSGRPITNDIGVLASLDPVALEQACMDLVKESVGGHNPFDEIHPHVRAEHIIEYAEQIGMGNREYDLVKI